MGIFYINNGHIVNNGHILYKYWTYFRFMIFLTKLAKKSLFSDAVTKLFRVLSLVDILSLTSIKELPKKILSLERKGGRGKFHSASNFFLGNSTAEEVGENDEQTGIIT